MTFFPALFPATYSYHFWSLALREPCNYDTRLTYPLLMDCISASVSELYHRTRRGPRSLLITSIAALRYYCTISYLRMAERCTIKSTYIHLDGHAKRGIEDLVCLRALPAWCLAWHGMAWHGCGSFDMLHSVFVGDYPLTHTGVHDAPVFYFSILCSHCLGIPMEAQP